MRIVFSGVQFIGGGSVGSLLRLRPKLRDAYVIVSCVALAITGLLDRNLLISVKLLGERVCNISHGVCSLLRQSIVSTFNVGAMCGWNVVIHRGPHWYAMKSGKQILAALLTIASLAMPIYVSAESASQAILIIDETDPDSPFDRQLREQIRTTLDVGNTRGYAIYTEFLDVGHFGEPNYDAVLRAYLNDKYRDKPISVVVALGTEALKFLSRTRSDLWKPLPVIFVAFEDVAATRSLLGSNATGIIVQRRFRDLVKTAQLLVPHLSQIALAGDPFERQPYRDYSKKELQEVGTNLNVIDLTGRPLGEVKRLVSALPVDSAIAYLPIYGDPTGISHNPAEALKAIADVANRPIVVDAESFVGMGAVGGSVLSAKDVGRETGRDIARILNGEDASNIPIALKEFTKPVFDSRQLKRWGINESALPAESDFRFREINVWERYRESIAAIGFVIAIQSLVIIWLVYEHHRRRVAERESHQHLLKVTKLDRAMTASAMSISIAHELNQPLSAILNNTEAAETLLTTNAPNLVVLKEILADIRHDDQRAVGIIKHLRALLKQDEIDPHDVDLNEVINDTFDILKPRAAEHGVTLQLEKVPPNLRIRGDSVHLQQVLLNLAMNAIDAMKDTPAGRRQLTLRVSRHGSEVMVKIEDTGPGIPDKKLKSIFNAFETTKQQGTGLGLSIAQTIIRTYGGTIWAENKCEGTGAVFCFTLQGAKVEAVGVQR